LLSVASALPNGGCGGAFGGRGGILGGNSGEGLTNENLGGGVLFCRSLKGVSKFLFIFLGYSQWMEDSIFYVKYLFKTQFI
jgi:hypothetical protein